MCQLVSVRCQLVSVECQLVSGKCRMVQEGVSWCQGAVSWCREGVRQFWEGREHETLDTGHMTPDKRIKNQNSFFVFTICTYPDISTVSHLWDFFCQLQDLKQTKNCQCPCGQASIIGYKKIIQLKFIYVSAFNWFTIRGQYCQ